MDTSSIDPVALPADRILGVVTPQRRQMLACIDVVVGYVAARHRLALVGWHLEAALVEARPGFRGGDTLALRARPEQPGRQVQDLPPVPYGVLREIASRVTCSLDGIANVVPDIASPAPDIDGVAVGAWSDPRQVRGNDARSA